MFKGILFVVLAVSLTQVIPAMSLAKGGERAVKAHATRMAAAGL